MSVRSYPLACGSCWAGSCPTQRDAPPRRQRAKHLSWPGLSRRSGAPLRGCSVPRTTQACCNDERAANALYGGGLSQGSPPRNSPGPGATTVPEHTLRGVRVWCLPRVPTEAMAWTVGTRAPSIWTMIQELPTKIRSEALTLDWQAREVLYPKRRSCPSRRPGKAGPGSIPWLTAAAQVGSGRRG